MLYTGMKYLDTKLESNSPILNKDDTAQNLLIPQNQ